MFRILFLLLALIDTAHAQILKRDELQEQIVPDSFTLTGSASASRIGNSFWRMSVNYAIVNKTGINLYLGFLQDGISLGSCGNAERVQGGLPLLPSPSAGSYSSSNGGGAPRGVFVPASGRIAGMIILDNCGTPNPGFPTAPLALTLMLGKAGDFSKMVTLPIDAEIPVRQLSID